MGDFLYKNAPLVEVIAEVHWQLKALQSHPQARIDPYYDLFRKQFVDHLKSSGFELVEQIVPKEIPIELLPYQPHVRLRRGPNEWPLFQIGPGLFTANIVPPYQGWKEFREHLTAGLSAVATCYPLSEKTINVGRTELRYIDAFTDALGMDKYAAFIGRHLAIPELLPKSLLDEFVPADGSPELRIENRFPLVKPEGSIGFVRVTPGMAGEKNAVIMELVCRKDAERGYQSPDTLAEWFDAAHLAVRTWFGAIASTELKEKMGPKTAIGKN